MNKYTGHRIPSYRTLADLIPAVHERAMEEVKSEVHNQIISIAFDGTTRLGDLIAMSARWCDDAFVLHHRAVCVQTLEKSPNALTLASYLEDSIRKRMPNSIIMSFARDSASTNGAALRQVQQSFSTGCDILCISHTLNNAGDHIAFPRVSEFLSAYLQLRNSPNAKAAWKSLTGKGMGGYSETRWWSKVRPCVHTHCVKHHASVVRTAP